MNWLLPSSIQHGPAAERQYATRLTQLALGFTVLGVLIAVILLLMDVHLAGLVTMGGAATMGMTPLLMRWTGSLRLAANALIAVLAVLMAGLAPMLGGIHAPNLPVITVCPLLAVFLVSRRAAVVWGALVAAVCLALYVVEVGFGVRFPMPIEGELLALLRATALCILVVISLIFVYLYDINQEQALSIMGDAHRRMVAMIAHLDATSRSLGRLAGEFLGVESGEDDAPAVGLTQQMLTTAGSSRAMIHRVQETIRGMIEQYSSISAGIRELNELSGTIAEMVHTIDNISDRLDLMALNTGIEAANAGVAGERFRLLAEDMRRLAERVLGETARIKTSIRAVQEHTRAATEASLAGQALTDEGVAQLEAMARVFDGMYALIERTADASKRITRETMRQLAAIQALVQTALHDDARDLAGVLPGARRPERP